MALPAQGLTWGTLMYHLPPPPPGRDCGLAAQASPAHRQGHACGLSNSSVTRSQNLSPGSWTARHSESGHPSGRTAARAQRSHERERETRARRPLRGAGRGGASRGPSTSAQCGTAEPPGLGAHSAEAPQRGWACRASCWNLGGRCEPRPPEATGVRGSHGTAFTPLPTPELCWVLKCVLSDEQNYQK